MDCGENMREGCDASDASSAAGNTNRTDCSAPLRADRLVRGTPSAELVYKIADSLDEREQAFRLVHDVYTAERLMHPAASGMRVTPWHLSEGTNIYVAKHFQRVVCTMTSVPDGERGLPLEEIYPSEVAVLRRAGHRLAEVTCLAARQDAYSTEQGFRVFVRLVGLLFQACRFAGRERLLIAVHPRHARFYRRALGFAQIGGVRTYPSVCDQPAVACEHDLGLQADPRFPLLPDVYGVRFAKRDLVSRPLAAAERDYLNQAVIDRSTSKLSFAS